MDFCWSPQQLELYKYFLEYSKKNLNNDVLRREENREHCTKSWQACANEGMLGLCVPSIYGGKGYDALTTAVITEAFGFGCQDTGLMFSTCAHLHACLMPIVEHGNDEQKSTFLPDLVSGKSIAANCITEENAGSDVFNIETTAIKDGDHYILNGVKSYVTNGPIADVFIVYAMNNPKHGYLGLSCFIVERGMAGLETTPAFKKMGLGTTQGGQVILKNCRVPAKNRLGQEGQGSLIFSRSMQWERSCLFAGFLGAAKYVLETTINYAKKRKQFKQSISKNQAVSHRLVNLSMQIESASLLLYKACWLIDQDKDATEAIAMANIAVSEAFVQASMDAIQIHGGYGYNRDNGIERYLRHAMGTTIFSGTSEIQRELISKRLKL